MMSLLIHTLFCLRRSIPFLGSKKGMDRPKTKKGMDQQRRPHCKYVQGLRSSHKSRGEFIAFGANKL